MAVLNEWMTVVDVAAHFQVCTRTVRNWIKHKHLRAARFGQRLRIDSAEIRRFEHAFLAPTDMDREAADGRRQRAKGQPRDNNGRFRKTPRHSKFLPRGVKTVD